jgi:hypothetical protein
MTTDERAGVKRCGSHEIRGDRPTGYTCSLPPGHGVDHQAFSDSGWRVASWPVQPDELPEWERELLEHVDPETGLLPPEQTVPRPSEAMIAAKWARLVSANEQLKRQRARLRQRVEKAEVERDEARQAWWAFADRLIPLGVAGFVMNAATGVCFLAGTPDQYFIHPAFQAKVLFFLVAGMNVAAFYLLMFRRVRQVGPGEQSPQLARIICGVSLCWWIRVKNTGRQLTVYPPIKDYLVPV